MFAFPSLRFRISTSESDSDSTEEESYADTISTHMKGHNIHSVDVTSDAFRALPTNIQHEILLELKDTRKQSSWSRLHQMPQVCYVYVYIFYE